MAKFTVRRGHFMEAAEWVWDQHTAREEQRVRSAVIDAVAPRSPSEVPHYEPLLPSLSKLRMGFSAFMEARAEHKNLGLWAVDYCDDTGPRVRIRTLVAEPTVDLGEWEIEVA